MLRLAVLASLLLAVLGLPLSALVTEQLRQDDACGEGRCCCAPDESASPHAGGCGAGEADEGPQLDPGCQCGSHGGQLARSAHVLSLALPGAAVALTERAAPVSRDACAQAAPATIVFAPDPPPPRALA